MEKLFAQQAAFMQQAEAAGGSSEEDDDGDTAMERPAHHAPTAEPMDEGLTRCS